MNFIHKLFTGDLLGISLMGSVGRETTPIRRSLSFFQFSTPAFFPALQIGATRVL